MQIDCNSSACRRRHHVRYGEFGSRYGGGSAGQAGVGVSRGVLGPCPCDIGRPVVDDGIIAQDGTRDEKSALGENKVSRVRKSMHILVGEWSEMGLTHPHPHPIRIFILGNPYTCLFN